MACAHVSHSSTFMSNALERDRARSSSSVSSSFSHSSRWMVAVKDPFSTCGNKRYNSHFAWNTGWGSHGTQTYCYARTGVLDCAVWHQSRRVDGLDRATQVVDDAAVHADGSVAQACCQQMLVSFRDRPRIAVIGARLQADPIWGTLSLSRSSASRCQRLCLLCCLGGVPYRYELLKPRRILASAGAPFIAG